MIKPDFVCVFVALRETSLFHFPTIVCSSVRVCLCRSVADNFLFCALQQNYPMTNQCRRMNFHENKL